MKLKLIVVIILGGLIFGLPVLSYSPHYTHPDLTEQMAKLFNNINKNGERAITSEEIQWLRQGAIDEDQPARWINHFYNPINGKGWTGSHFGYLTSEQGLATVADIAAREPIPSTDWVTNQDYQAAYGRQFGNQTWQKAIKSYTDGDKKSAFIALGHIMHLVEDATVPDHTRDDTHADLYGDPGSPYEKYSADFTNFNKLTFADDLKNNQFLSFSSIKDVISGLAVYSNNNFLSADTINDSAYKLPQLKSFEIVEKNINGQDVALIYSRTNNLYLAIFNGFDYTINDKFYVLPSYASHLMPKAVQYGASAMNLFFNEVDKYKSSGEKIIVTKDTNVPFKQALIAAPKLAGLGVVDTLGQAKSDILIALNNSLSILPVSIASGVRSKFGIASLPANTQSNSKITTPPETQTPPPEPVNPPATVETPQPPKPPTPAPKPTPVPPILENVLVSTPVIIDAPAPVVVPLVSPQPTYILAFGYNPPAPPAAPIVIVEEDVATTTSDSVVSSTTPSAEETVTSTEPVVTSTISVTTTVEISTTTITTTTPEISTSTLDVTTTVDTVTTTTSTPIVEVTVPEVVINEVAWAGTASTRANDEWFELYNNTDHDIDLTDWKILVSGAQINFSKINNKIISAHGYYLLERKEDSVIRDIGADAVYTYTVPTGFNNNGEKLELFNSSSQKVDEVDASGGWFAGDNTKYRSMERLDPTKNGNDPANWQSNQGNRPTGQNVSWAPVYGSPRQSNFGFVMLSGIQEDAVRTLDIKNSPYVVWSYRVPVEKILNVDPGVNIFLQTYGSIEINGSLNAIGAQDKPINFISYSTSTAWANLRFNNSTSTFNFVNFRRGDRITRLLQNLDGMILAKNSNLALNNVLIWDSEANAIGGTDSVLNIFNTTIGASVKNNKTYGINVRGGALSLDNVVFNNLYVGIEVGGAVESQPILNKENMSNSSFINVDYPVEPLSWWNAVSSTLP